MAVELPRNMSRQPSRESTNGSMNSCNSEGKSVKHLLSLWRVFVLSGRSTTRCDVRKRSAPFERLFTTSRRNRVSRTARSRSFSVCPGAERKRGVRPSVRPCSFKIRFPSKSRTPHVVFSDPHGRFPYNVSGVVLTHLPKLLSEINTTRRKSGEQSPETLTIICHGF